MLTHGFVHSIESLGALDGPGLRTVIFLQGCHLKCKFCHNIDTNEQGSGTKYAPQELVEKILKNREYWDTYKSKKPEKEVLEDSGVQGGVTFSGGEPSLQWEFILECIKLLKKEDIHIAIDTCMFTTPEVIDEFLPYVDLWMVSIKHMDSKQHESLTTVPNEKIFSNIVYLDAAISENKEINSKIRTRFVLIPGITDENKHLNTLATFVSKLKNLECLELLPYSTVGKAKWLEIFGHYNLEGIPEPTQEQINTAQKALSVHLPKVKV